MSHDATGWAWSQQGITSPQKIVLLCLADRADEEDICWPSVKRLTQDTCLDIKTVRKCLKELEKMGLVSTSHRPGTSARYKLIGVTHREDQTPTKNGATKSGTTNFGGTNNGSTKSGTPAENGTTKSGTPTKNGSTDLGSDPYQKRSPTPTKFGTRIFKESLKNLDLIKYARNPDGIRAENNTLVCDLPLAKAIKKLGQPAHEDLTVYFLPVKSPADEPDVAFIRSGSWDAWAGIYGADFCLDCLRQAYAWCLANPTKQKTPSGIHTFMNNWLKSEQNKRRDSGPSTSPVKTANKLDQREQMAREVLEACDDE